MLVGNDFNLGHRRKSGIPQAFQDALGSFGEIAVIPVRRLDAGFA